MKRLVTAALVLGACSPASFFHPPDGQSGSGADAPGLPTDGNGDGAVPTDGNPVDAAWTWQTLIANYGDVNGGSGVGYEIDGCPHAGSSTTCTMPSYSTACAQIPITQDMWIDGFRPGTNGVSDLASDFQSTVPTDDHRFIIVSRAGCGVTEQSYTWNRDDEIVYAAGLGSNAEFRLPPGTAVHLTPTDAQGNQLYLVIFDRLVNYYKVNPMYGTSRVEAHVVDGPTDGLQAVDMVLGGEGTFALAQDPSGTAVPVDGQCTPIGTTSGYQWNIVALWPHMHNSGKHSKVSLHRSADPPDSLTPLYDADYVYKDQQTHILDTPVTLGYNDTLVVECDISAQSEALSYDEVAPEQDWGRTVCWTGIYKYPPGTDTYPGTPTGPETCVANNGTRGFKN